MPVRKAQNLTHTLVAGFREMFSSGVLHPGSKLPPERELAKYFGVNRASVRQALKALDVMGILHQRVGDGTYVTNDASTTLGTPLDFLILVDGITFAELFEALRIVEPELAARAARLRTEADVADLERAVAVMKSSASIDKRELAKQDLNFHEIIWRASGNRVCERMFSSLHQALSRSLRMTLAIRDNAPVSAHDRICQAIKAGDDATARNLMFEYLLLGETLVLKENRQVVQLEQHETITV